MNTSHRHLRAFSVLVAAAISASAQAPPIGEISGLILAPDGKPLASALVTAVIVSRVAPRQDSMPVISVLAATSAPDGTFTISSVPVGDWKVCAELHDPSQYLNTCRWNGGPVAHVTSAGTRAVTPAIRFAAGAKLHIRLADDAGEFQKAGAKAELPVFGIPMANGFVALPMVGSDAGGRDYEILVPFDMDHKVMAMSRSYVLADEKGASVATTAIPVRFASGSTPAPITVHLTGHK